MIKHDWNSKLQDTLILESVRAGVPSRESVEALPDVRAEQLMQINSDLEELQKGEPVKGRVLWGEYGQGKTHFLKQVEKHIISQGYAVSYLSLSPELGLNKLEALFPALSARIITKDSRIPGLLNRLITSAWEKHNIDDLADQTSQLSHPLPWMMFQSFPSPDFTNLLVLYNALMGKKENFSWAKTLVKKDRPYEYKAMPKFTLKQHYISFFEFMSLLIRSLGYKGWVILIDELEIIGRMGAVSRLNSYKNLSWLLRLNKANKLPFYTICAAAKSLQTEVFYGTKKRDAQEMPRLALTRGDDQGSAILTDLFYQLTQKRSLVLSQIQPNKLTPLLESIYKIHRHAIPWHHEPPHELIPSIIKRINPQSKPIRQVIRMFIESLDICAVYGTIPGKFTAKIVENYGFDDPVE